MSPDSPLEACAFGAHLGNPSVCILDPHLELAQELYDRWGRLMLFSSSFESRKLFRWMNHWKQGVGLWIHLGLLTEQTTRKKHRPKREGTSRNSRRSSYGKHGGGEVIFFYSEDPYLTSHSNDYRTTLRFGLHRHVCKCSYHWHKRGLWEICGSAPSTNEGVFTFGRSFYFFYFVAFQDYAMLQSTIHFFLNRHVLGQT